MDEARGVLIGSDGMGGHANGAAASKMVVELLPPLLDGLVDARPNALPGHLRDAVRRVSARIERGARGRLGRDGMGATVVLAILRGAPARGITTA
jgi:serine/threonine protein phosphatase PrpC